jgi:hypothetical protein
MGAPTGLLCAVASERRRAKMEGEKRERWMRLCVEAADGQDSNRLLDLISEINRLLREKEMRLRNVRREASRYVIEASEEKAS